MEFIAEIGQAHEGSLGLAMSYIDALADTGVNTIKFQVHIAEAESSIHEPFRISFSQQDKNRFEYWKRMEFSIEEWGLIKKRCEDHKLEFLASPFSIAAVELLEELGIKRYKIGSGEVNNLLLLERISRTGKPIILSSGMSSFEELDLTVDFLKNKKVEFSILQCSSTYPSSPKNYGFNIIDEFQKRYKVPIGFSDHSAKIETCIAAATLGAEIVEFHAVFDRRSFGPDASSSLEIEEIKFLVSAVKNIKLALTNPVNKEDTSFFKEMKGIFEKSIAVNKDLAKGHILKIEDLESKKPKGYGILTSDYKMVVGKKLNKDLGKWDFVKEEDII